MKGRRKAEDPKKMSTLKSSKYNTKVIDKVVQRTHCCDFPECGFKTTSDDNLKAHKRRRHEHGNKRELKCPLCPYAAKNGNCIKTHLQMHAGVRNFPCPICPHRTTRQSHLDIHMRIHTGEKPYKCSFCPYAAADKRNVTSHEFIHLKLKPFSCSFCPYKSTQKSHLNEHLKRHLKEKSFTCPYCNYTAVCKSSLKSHIQTHFDPQNRKKQCPVAGCKYAAAQHTPWKAHLKNRHGLNAKEILEKLKANPEARFRTKKHFQPSPQQLHMIFHRYKCPENQCLYKTNKLQLLAAHLNVHKLPKVLLTRILES